MSEQMANEAGNKAGSVTIALPKEEYRMDLDLENVRRQLIALRVKHGANTPIGHRCSNIVELLQNKAPPAAIAKQMVELDRLLKGSQ